MARIALVTSKEGLEGRQLEVFNSIAGSRPNGVRGPHAVLLNNPDLAGTVEALGRYVRFECSVPQRWRELAILAISVHWKTRYEWYAHSAIALSLGISDDVQRALAAGAEPEFENEDDALVFFYVKQTLQGQDLEPDPFAKLQALLTPNGILDLAALVGYYTMLAFILNTFQVEPPVGTVPW